MGDTKKTAVITAAAMGTAFILKARAKRERMDYDGKVIVITGGSRGLGLVLAREFARRGARLALLGRGPEELERARQELSSSGAEVLTIPCDIRAQEHVDAAIQQVIQHFGALDVLVNNASVIQAGPLEHMKIEDFDEAMAVHFRGPLYTMLASIPQMRQQGHGRIVNISSIGGKIAIPHLVPYSASKFALVGLSDGMRAELARYGIRVTTVCPGLMRTGSHLNASFKGRHAAEFGWFSIGNALPISSVSARSAAQQIVNACRKGDPELVISPQAKAMTIGAALFPGVTAKISAAICRLLPGPNEPVGDELRSGWDSRSPVVPSFLTHLSDRATVRNNELKGHTSVDDGLSD